MKSPKIKACRECPFRRKSLASYVGSSNPEDFIANALFSEQPLPCHLEVDYESDEWKEQSEEVHQCTGHAIFLTNSCKTPRNINTKTLPRNTVDFFGNMLEFLKHHDSSYKDKDTIPTEFFLKYLEI